MITLFPAFALALACVIHRGSAYQEYVERELILSGNVVPAEPRLYGFRWVSIGEHYRNGTGLGEQIKIVSLMNHPNYSENAQYADDFMVVELERPSKYKPVKLAAADDSDFKPGKVATAMGWGTNAEADEIFSYELKRVHLPLASDHACAAYATVDSSMVCAGGAANHDTCEGDSGGPLVVESVEDDDVLIGVTSWSKDDTCGREGYYGVYSRVSSARAWIETITRGSGTCLP